MAAPAEHQDIFDRKKRAQILARGEKLKRNGQAEAVLIDHMGEEIAARLQWVKRQFSRILIIGHAPEALLSALYAQPDMAEIENIACDFAAPHGDMVERKNAETPPFRRIFSCDEDRILPSINKQHNYDLVVAIGTLDSVNDLPGTLVQIRQLLKPDGLFMAAMLGAGTLPLLKRAMLAGDEAAATGMAQHIHPQIDVRTMGDLLQRTGLALPVVDEEQMRLRYRDVAGLLRDLRGSAWSNALSQKRPYLGKAGYRAIMQNFTDMAEDDGKFSEIFNLIYVSAWSPSPDQPKPAKRGSATISLADALKDKA